jgi:hypothetical protein
MMFKVRGFYGTFYVTYSSFYCQVFVFASTILRILKCDLKIVIILSITIVINVNTIIDNHKVKFKKRTM